jgi:hypothetical protein
MSLWSRSKEAYGESRSNGRTIFRAGITAPFKGAWRGVKDRTADSYNKSRNNGENVVKSTVYAFPRAVQQKSAENVVTEPFANLSTWFLIFAMLINFWIEIRNPTFRFSGFDLDFFNSVVRGGDWIGIYNIFHFNIFFLVIIFTYFNLKDGKPHILRVWLGLILVTYLLSAVPILNTYMGMRNVMEFFLLLFVVIQLSFSQDPKWDDLVSTITVLWVMYNLYMFGATGGGALLHFVFFILFLIIFGFSKKYKEDRTQIKWWLLIIILFDFFLPDFFARIYPNLPIATLPFLTFGVLLFAQVYEPTWLTSFLIILFVMFYFIKFTAMGEAFQRAIGFRQANDEDFEERKNPFSPRTWSTMIRDWMNQSVYYASGQDYYASQVDENAKKELGVYLKDVQDNPKSFYDYEKAILSATLTAENFASEEELEDKAIDIKLSCEAWKSDKAVAKGRIYPRDDYKIETYDLENIECIFEPWQLEKGNHIIKFKASFNFETQAYLKQYFVSKNTIDALRRKDLIKKDEDILTLNKIEDVVPVAKNSVGPVKIESSDKFPSIIKLDASSDVTQLFSIQLKNAWKGKIEQIKNLQLFLPEGISISEGECRFSMLPAPLPSDRYEGYVNYELAETRNNQLKNIEKELTQSCGLNIRSADIENILQPGDVTTRYFRMITKYIYNLEESVGVSIKEPGGLHINILSVNGKVLDSSSKLACELKDEKSIGHPVTFKVYKDYSEIPAEENRQLCSGKSCKYSSPNKYPNGTNIKCEAIVEKDRSNTENNPVAVAYVKVKNSPPVIKDIGYKKDEVQKGEFLECYVDVDDEDDDKVMAQFDFEGLNIASTVKECSNGCSVTVPTDSTEKDTTFKCMVTLFDPEGQSEQKIARAGIKVA